jgi:hypothetical protein
MRAGGVGSNLDFESRVSGCDITIDDNVDVDFRYVAWVDASESTLFTEGMMGFCTAAAPLGFNGIRSVTDRAKVAWIRRYMMSI